MNPVYIVVDKSSPLLNPPIIEQYQLALQKLESGEVYVDQLINNIEEFVQGVLKEAFNQTINLEQLKLSLHLYHQLGIQMIKVILKQQDTITVPQTYISPTHYVLIAIPQYLLLQQFIDPIRQKLVNQIDQEVELTELEYSIEASRKLLNKAKFSVVTGQLENIVQLLQDCNLVFDKIFELRKIALSPDFFKLLNVTIQSTPLEIKKAYYQIAKSLHPDNDEDNITLQDKKRKQRLFQKVAEAYDVLTNPQKRQQYITNQYNSGEISQRLNIHNNRKKASYDVPPDYKGNSTLSDEEMRKYLNDEQWFEYQKQRRQEANANK